MAARPVVGVDGTAMWAAGRLTGTVVGARGVTLAWELPEPPPLPDPADGVDGDVARGLAVDRFCRVYAVTADDVVRTRFGDTTGGVDYARVPPGRALFAGSAATVRPDDGGFGAVDPAPPLLDPVGVGVDADDLLVVAERGAGRVSFLDLWSRRLVRRVELAPRRPQAIAVDGRTVWVLLAGPAGLVRCTARGAPVEVALPPLPPGGVAVRITVLDGQPVLLVRTPDGHARLVATGRTPVDVGGASDLTTLPGRDPDRLATVVVAPPAGGRYLTTWAPVGDTWTRVDALDAAGQDGGGIAATAAGRIVYSTAAGLRLASGARVRYAPEGTVTTVRLDSGTPGARWGRLFLDACRPDGTDVLIAVTTTDDDLLPPPAAPPTGTPLVERRDDPTPWSRNAADDPVQTLEGWVDAPAGRYSWVHLYLRGGTRVSPTVRRLRLEAATHTLSRRLPVVYADHDDTTFLHRYLALADGVLHDLERRADQRQVLVRPQATPVEALDWLASFVGLVLDERWPVADRRALVAEAAWLFRYRGTVAALRRYLALYLHVEPVVVEAFRMRGVSTDATPFAHRFTVIVPRPLDAEAHDVVTTILARERPAHTVVEVCTVDAGLRVGRADHLGLSTVVGRTGGFTEAVLDRAVLGRDATVGRPAPGPVVEASRLGRTRVG